MTDINLLQNQLKDTTLASKHRTQLAAAISAAVLILLVMTGAGLYFLKANLDKEVGEILIANAKLQKQIDTGNERLKEAKIFQAQLSNIDLLLKNHIYMTPIFEELTQYTYNRTKFKGITINQSLRRVHVEGEVENYEGLSKLLLGLSTSNNFSNVRLNSVTGSDGGFRTFSIDMTAIPSIFIIE